MGWGLLIPRGWAGMLTLGGVGWGLVSTVRFSDTVTVGSIIVASMVIVAGGVITFRNNMRTFWRNLAEERAEQIKVLEEHARERELHLAHMQEQWKAELAKTVEEQREVRHELKAQLAAAVANLRVEQAKTDLSAVLEESAKHHKEAMANMEMGLERQTRMLDLLEARK